MELITLRENYILKEYLRSIERETDKLHIDFCVVPKRGTTIDDTQILRSFALGLTFDKHQEPELWDVMKEASQDVVLRYLYNTIKMHYVKYQTIKDAEDSGDETLWKEASASYAEYHNDAAAMSISDCVKNEVYPIAKTPSLFYQLRLHKITDKEISVVEV